MYHADIYIVYVILSVESLPSSDMCKIVRHFDLNVDIIKRNKNWDV